MTYVSDFIRFHRANPRVWELFKRFSMDLILAGRPHHSADSVIHRIRWETAICTTDAASEFKINDHYSSLYARLFHLAFPDYGNFFRVRKLSGDEGNVMTMLRMELSHL